MQTDQFSSVLFSGVWFIQIDQPLKSFTIKLFYITQYSFLLLKNELFNACVINGVKAFQNVCS